MVKDDLKCQEFGTDGRKFEQKKVIDNIEADRLKSYYTDYLTDRSNLITFYLME